MSEIEHWKGTLIPVPIIVDVENTAKLILEKLGMGKASYNDTYLEELRDSLYKEYVFVNGMLYKIEGSKQDPYADIYIVQEKGDGEFDFELKFYNGGCGFDEAIELAFKKLEKDKQ